MADAVTASLSDLNDPAKYICKTGVPIFRAHKRSIWNDKKQEWEDVEVLESDLPTIAEHMQAVESEGRLFRLTNGHVKKKPDGTMDDQRKQPELFGLARNARVGKFGPEQIDCVMWDEYYIANKLPDIRDKIYRSAEYYRGQKMITGAAALVTDPQLNLGQVLLYDSDDGVAICYGEPMQAQPQTPGPIPPSMDKPDDLTPEEINLFEKMLRYMQNKSMMQQAAAMGPQNAGPPQAGGNQEPMMSQTDKKPDAVKPPEVSIDYAKELDFVKAELKAAQDKIGRVESERDNEQVERLIYQLEVVEHYEFDVKAERDNLLKAVPADRPRIVERIRKYHSVKPGFEKEIPVDYSAGDQPLPDRPGESKFTKEPPGHEEALQYCRDTGETDYLKALKIVNAKK